MFGAGVLLGDEVLGAGDEVLPGVRLRLTLPGEVPLLAVLAAAAHPCERQDASALKPHQPLRTEAGRSVLDAVSAVAVEERRVRAVTPEAALVEDDERDERAVVALHADGLGLDAGHVNRNRRDELRIDSRARLRVVGEVGG